MDTALLAAFIGLGGALLGSFLGAWFAFLFAERRYKMREREKIGKYISGTREEIDSLHRLFESDRGELYSMYFEMKGRLDEYRDTLNKAREDLHFVRRDAADEARFQVEHLVKGRIERLEDQMKQLLNEEE